MKSRKTHFHGNPTGSVAGHPCRSPKNRVQCRREQTGCRDWFSSCRGLLFHVVLQFSELDLERHRFQFRATRTRIWTSSTFDAAILSTSSKNRSVLCRNGRSPVWAPDSDAGGRICLAIRPADGFPARVDKSAGPVSHGTPGTRRRMRRGRNEQAARKTRAGC